MVQGRTRDSLAAGYGDVPMTVQASKGMRKMKADSLADLVTMAARLRLAPALKG